MLKQNPYAFRINLEEGFPTQFELSYSPEFVAQTKNVATLMSRVDYLDLLKKVLKRCYWSLDDIELPQFDIKSDLLTTESQIVRQLIIPA